MGTAVLDPSCVWDADKDSQAIRALLRINDKDQEVGGALYKNAAGEYCYSLPVPSGSKDTFSFGVKVPQGAQFAGMYHTHPTDPGSGEWFSDFSEPDKATAAQLKQDSYIRILRNGHFKKLAVNKGRGKDITPAADILDTLKAPLNEHPVE